MANFTCACLNTANPNKNNINLSFKKGNVGREIIISRGRSWKMLTGLGCLVNIVIMLC